MNNRVLVTGANGYIGVHVVKEFLRRGFQVVANDLNFDRVPLEAERLSGNVFDPTLDFYELSGKPDYVVHLVWRNGFQHGSDSHLQDLPLHISFLRRMVESGVSHLSVMGSMHEIGYWEGAIRNDTPANPQSFYGIAKNALRQAMEIIVKDKPVNFCWLRGFYLYGDDERNHSVLTKILEAEREGKEFFPFTSGKNLYDFISIEDFSRQIVAATVQDEYMGIINCCSGEPMSLGEMCQKFIREKGLKIQLQYGAFPDRPYDSPGVWGDASVIRKILEKEV